MAQPNQLNPVVTRIGLADNVWIYAGSAYTDALIQAEVGTPGTDQAQGSLYLSTTSGSPAIWRLVDTTWTAIANA